jgi:hypothetical protein
MEIKIRVFGNGAPLLNAIFKMNNVVLISLRNGFAVASMPTFVTTLSSGADKSRSVPNLHLK